MLADSGDGRGLDIFRHMSEHSVFTVVAAPEFFETYGLKACSRQAKRFWAKIAGP